MLPYLDFTNQIDSICQLLIGKNIIISRPSQLILTQKYKFNKVLGDYTLNIWNTKSAEWFKQHNLTVFIAHPELSLSQIEIIEDTIGIEFLLIGSSQLPFGYTRACFSELGICGKSCHNQSTSLLNLNKGYNVELICDNEFGYRTITDNCIYVSVDQSSNHRKVIGVIGLTESEKKEILHSKKILSTNTSVIYI